MFEQNILGGEAAMWSEQVEGVAVEAKLWPRVAALGERLWADPESGNTKHWECYPDFLGAISTEYLVLILLCIFCYLGWKQAESRMVHMRERMVDRGIAADALQPEWCHQNEALCYVKKTA